MWTGKLWCRTEPQMPVSENAVFVQNQSHSVHEAFPGTVPCGDITSCGLICDVLPSHAAPGQHFATPAQRVGGNVWGFGSSVLTLQPPEDEFSNSLPKASNHVGSDQFRAMVKVNGSLAAMPVRGKRVTFCSPGKTCLFKLTMGASSCCACSTDAEMQSSA